MALPQTSSLNLRTLRRFRSVCALVLLSVLASSCYSLDANVVVNEDGTGSFVVEYIVDKDTSEASLLAGDLVAACDAVQVMQNAAPAGAVFTPLESSSQCGARLEMEFASEAELVQGMATISERSRFSGFGHFPDIAVNRGAEEGTWNFMAQFKPPLPTNLETQTDFRNEVSQGRFTLAVDLPGRQVEHNADRIDENGVMIFEINPLVDASGQMFVQTEPGPKIVGVAESSSFPWNLAIFALLAIAAIAAAVMILRRSKKRRQYEGDDDGSIISSSERLGLGSSDHEEPVTAPEELVDPAGEAAIPGAVDAAMPAVQEPTASALFSESVDDQSWPASPEAAPASPVFAEAQAEVGREPTFESQPQSWVAATQAIEGTPEPIEAMADWPGTSPADPTPAPAFGSTEDAGLPGSLGDVGDGWPSGPLVASSAGAPAAAAVIIDHSTDEISSIPQATQAEADPAFGGQLEQSSLAAPTAAWPEVSMPAEQPVATTLDSVEAAPVEAAPVEDPVVPIQEDPVAPSQEATIAPTQEDMVWDEQRNTYVVYDHRRASWMAFDNDTQAWVALS